VGPDARRSIDGVRVLVVDDEADVRGAVAGLLEGAGATVLALDSGATVASALAAFRPDVLVLDIGMPGEDGYTLIRRIRSLPERDGGGIPAISLTAHARAEDRQLALDSGFQAHLPKPVHDGLLMSTISQLAAQRASEASGSPESRRSPTADAR
jgi:CheY-like chemotaxis protein